MAPIHHHFEKKGWPEFTVVIRFWIISIILAMIGLATLKKIMNANSKNFEDKKILIYGLGASGISVLNFKKKKNKIYLFDDNKKKHYQLIK